MLDLSVANVQQILSRALRKLRQQLEGAPGPEDVDGPARAGEREA